VETGCTHDIESAAAPLKTPSLAPNPALLSARVIFRIHVLDVPRPGAVELNDGFAIRSRVMDHACRESEKAASLQILGGLRVRLFTHAKAERP